MAKLQHVHPANVEIKNDLSKAQRCYYEIPHKGGSSPSPTDNVHALLKLLPICFLAIKFYIYLLYMYNQKFYHSNMNEHLNVNTTRQGIMIEQVQKLALRIIHGAEYSSYKNALHYMSQN